jgi:ABC-2 type transport system permease protein
MIWKIARPHIWLLDPRLRTTNRFVVVGSIALVLFAGQWAYLNLVEDRVAQLGSEQLAAFVAPLLPFSLFVFLLFTVLAIDDMVRCFYLAGDIEMLMVAPIPLRIIFLVKLAQSSRASLIPGLMYGTLLFVVGWIQEATVLYYVLVLVLLAAVIILVTAVIMSLVLSLVRLLPAQKVRAWIPLAVVSVMLLLALGQQPAVEWFLAHETWISFLLGALLNIPRLALTTAVAAVFAVAVALAAYGVFVVAFYEGWNRFRSVPAPHRIGIRGRRLRKSVVRTGRRPPSAIRHLAVKEWLEMWRNPSTRIGLALPLVYLVLVAGPLLGSGQSSESVRPLIFWYVLSFSALLLCTLPTGIPLLSVLQEGRNIALLQSLPVSMSTVLTAKFWATWLPMVSLWAVAFPLIGAWQGFRLWQTLLLVCTSLVAFTGTTVVTMALGGLYVDFRISEPKRRIPKPLAYGMMFLNMSFVFLVLANSVWLMALLFPEDGTVKVIETLAENRFVGWVFSDSVWLPIAFVGGQLVFWVGAKLLWRAAAHRLEQWEES